MFVLRRMAILLDVSMAVSATVASATTCKSVMRGEPRGLSNALPPGRRETSFTNDRVRESAIVPPQSGVPMHGAALYRYEQAQCAPVLGFQGDFRGHWRFCLERLATVGWGPLGVGLAV